MPSVLDRSALEQSPLADLHLLANELGVDGFRRLRKPDLVDAIVARQSGDGPAEEEEPEAAAVEAPAAAVEAPAAAVEAPAAAAVEAPAATAEETDEEPRRGRRGRRGGRGRARGRDEDAEVVAEAPEEKPGGEDRIVQGVVELLANGSGFLRLSPPEESDDDVYISAAQVKRCELVSGDKVAGPLRAPRRSERFPSLVRVDTINGRPADEVAEGTRFEDLPVAWPSERIQLGSGDPTVKAIQWLTPFGKGSRVVIAGPSRSGKTEAIRRLAEALVAHDGLEINAVLAGVRPEEVADWPLTPGAVLSVAASPDAQAQAVEQAIEQGRRVAARGGDAVVLVDGLAYLPESAARRSLAAGRNLASGGSLTVIATALAPVGGETTVVALDAEATALGHFPALSLKESGTLRPELLVGDAGAQAIRAARAGGPVEAPPEPEAAPEPVAEPAPAPAAKKPAARAKKPAAAAKKPAAAAKKPAAAAKKPVAAKKAAEKKPAAKAKAPAAKKAAAKKPAAKKAAAKKSRAA
jgi:transcription termination factor Rho